MEITHLRIEEAAFMKEFDLKGIPLDYVLKHFNEKLKVYPCVKNIRGYFNMWWNEHHKRIVQLFVRMQGNAEYKRIQAEERAMKARIQEAKDVMYLNFCKKRGLDPDTKEAGDAFYLEVIAK